MKDSLKKAEEWLAREYSQIHTGRASPAILDSVAVEAYGTFSPIKNVASVSIEDPRTLRVMPWDKSMIKAIEKAITASNLGLSVSTDDAGVRVAFPQLTTERRAALVKVLKEKLEQARVMVRNAREEAISELNDKEKAGAISEDDKFRQKEKIQEEVDAANNRLEGIFSKFETDVMSGEK